MRKCLPALRGAIGAAAAAMMFVAATPVTAAAEPGFFAGDYPLDVVVSHPVALFHWVDSLAGTSRGKTIPAYQREYRHRFGKLSSRDFEVLLAFRDARSRSHAAGGTLYTRMLEAFCEAPDVAKALESLRGLVGAADVEAMRVALEHYRPKYERIWKGGEVPGAFVERARSDPGRRRLASLLNDIARFLGVDPASSEVRPRVVLVPVPSGYGTHAEAVGPHLLIEVRPDDVLGDQASVIVHENVHFLMGLIGSERNERLAAAMTSAGPAGKQAWATLREALPTALGQGVADRAFRPALWSPDEPWYHTDEVDSYAKSLYPLVRSSLESGARFDEDFVRRALERYPRENAVTPR